jgi:hypothetical protein
MKRERDKKERAREGDKVQIHKVRNKAENIPEEGSE